MFSGRISTRWKRPWATTSSFRSSSTRKNDLASVIGKSRSHVANTLRLLKLPEPVKQYLNDGALTAGHARALIAAPDPAALAKRIV